MKVILSIIPDVLILEPKVFGDARGFFMESFNQRAFQQATGLDLPFVQDNHSKSAHGVLRGLHYQIEHAQGKLVRVVGVQSLGGRGSRPCMISSICSFLPFPVATISCVFHVP